MSKRMTRYPTDRKVYVGDLGDNARKNDLEHTFGSYGKLRSVWVARNPPGFAFVEFEDARDAADAVRALDGRKLCGTRARVELSTGRISGNGRRGGGDRTRDNGRATKCYECGGRGHYARECRKWGRSRRRSYSQSRSRSDSRERKSNSRSRGSQSRSVSDPKEIQKSRDVHTSKTKRSDRSQNGETHRSGNGEPNGSRRDSLTTKRRYSDSEPSISPKRNSRSVTHRREESSYSRSRSRSPSTSRRN